MSTFFENWQQYWMLTGLACWLWGQRCLYLQLRREPKKPPKRGYKPGPEHTLFRFVFRQTILSIVHPISALAFLLGFALLWPLLVLIVCMNPRFMDMTTVVATMTQANWAEGRANAASASGGSCWDVHPPHELIDEMHQSEQDHLEFADLAQALTEWCTKVAGFCIVLFGVGLSIGAAFIPTPAKAQSKDKQTRERPPIEDPVESPGAGPDPGAFDLGLVLRFGGHVVTQERLRDPVVRTPVEQAHLALDVDLGDGLTGSIYLQMEALAGDGDPLSLALIAWKPLDTLNVEAGRFLLGTDLGRRKPPHKIVPITFPTTGIASPPLDQGLRATFTEGPWLLDAGVVTGSGLAAVPQDLAFDGFVRAQGGWRALKFGFFNQTGPQPEGLRHSTGGYAEFDVGPLFAQGEFVRSVNPLPDGRQETRAAWGLLGGRPIEAIDVYGRAEFLEIKGDPTQAKLLLGSNWRPTDSLMLRFGADTTWELGPQSRTRAPTGFGFHAAIQAIH